MNGDLLLIVHFCSDFDGKGNNRFNYLAEFFANNNFSVELVTSDFSHNKKRKREKNISKDINYKVTFIEEPVYKKNVSLKRFYSHYAMSENLKKYLKFRKKPSVIYCSVPSLDVAATAAKYAKENNIKFIIDVQDLWPEAFKMVFNIPIISNMLFYPMKKKADYIYKSADEIVAVSKTYLNRALEVNRKVEEGKVVFLGTDLSKFDEAFINNKYQNKAENQVWVAYAGTLGHSYDLTSVFDALEILKNKGINDLKLIVMGDGPLKEKFEEYAKAKQINTLFTGRLPYGEMVGLLGVCDIAVNPIASGSAGTIINKVGDYAAAGLPVINTQECLEYRNLVDEYQMGLNCNNNDSKDLAEKLLVLLKDNEMKNQMGKNSRRLAEEKFDRSKTYKEIMTIIEKV
ncbi:glycosyltransferase involved in cell wall biosynthesis [Anaerosolibacter carboniphilus]|uniref:Glycosyltransferase involved in cell wall biosynthesis n=1 Tax=Anaerosolibacter carboniphilus TaxID=1417629 RepID=A0A841L1V5_9FIRM|nr:glycosyltransferase family 4 protein [Anaerosolibacter carboniphilus]MBB6216369.1 glycosyltransferase involved in cell wall biosynthesis [Anaerosolibacter carboniphilus]